MYMPYANDKRLSVGINTSTSGDNEIIAAPGAGGFFAVGFFLVNSKCGSKTLILKSGSTERFRVILDEGQPFVLENTIHDPEGILTCASNSAFNLNLSAATQVTGYIKYRKVT